MWHSRYPPKALYLLLQTYGATVLSLKTGFAVCSSRLTLQGKGFDTTSSTLSIRSLESQLPVLQIRLCSQQHNSNDGSRCLPSGLPAAAWAFLSLHDDMQVVPRL